MSGATTVVASPAPVTHDFDQAYKLGRLCGEVRVLKWAVGAALVAILASMGVLYDAIGDVGVELTEIRKDISGLRMDVTGVQRDVTAIDARVVIIEEKVSAIEEDLADLRADVSDLKAMHSSPMEEAHGSYGNSRRFPEHVDSVRSPAPPARATPPG